MISTPTTDKAFLKREAVRRCAKSVLAVDAGKFGNKAVIAVNRVEDYDILVTDRILTDGQREILAAGGTEVMQV
jgi:DeoR/GlpR family transcriptional regulator of sugar metabolism